MGGAGSRARAGNCELDYRDQSQSRAQASLRAHLDAENRCREEGRISAFKRSPVDAVEILLDMRILRLEFLLTFGMPPEYRKKLEAELLHLTTSRSIQRRAHILALPTELLSQIFSFLATRPPNLWPIRLTCCRFERAAWPPYAKSFDEHIFHPTDNSLSALVALSRHPIASLCLKELKISTVKLVKCGPRATGASWLGDWERDYRKLIAEGLGISPGCEETPRHASEFQWMREARDRETLVRVLRKALAEFENLETVCVVDDDEIPDIKEPTLEEIEREKADTTLQISKAARYMPQLPVRMWLTLQRELQERAWSESNTAKVAKAAGWHHARHLIEQSGWLFERKAHRHTLDIVYKTLRQQPALIGTAAFLPRLRELKCQGRVNIASLFSCRASSVGGSGSSGPASMCSGVRLLQIKKLELAVATYHQRHEEEEMDKDLRLYVPDFLATMPNLTDVKLDFQRSDYVPTSYEKRYFRPLTSGQQGLDTIFTTTTFSHLERLHVVNLNTSTPNALMNFLHAHRSTLKELTFTDLAMRLTCWRSFYQFLGQAMQLEDFVNIWESKDWERRMLCYRRWRALDVEFLVTSEELGAASAKGTKFIERGEEMMGGV